MTDKLAPAPRPTFRLIPSQFPPIGLFDTVATAADAAAVMELAGWTNDRLLTERINRLPQEQWVYGRPNSSIIMASFLHAAPNGMRFNGPDLGAWYACAAIKTAAAEVGHHLRREAVARAVPAMQRIYRSYTATLSGLHLDIRGRQKEFANLYETGSHAASQLFGEKIRSSDTAGIIYDSLRHEGGTNIVGYRPRNITEVTQADHYEITVRATSRQIRVRKLST